MSKEFELRSAEVSRRTPERSAPNSRHASPVTTYEGRLCSVALPVPVPKLFTYAVSTESVVHRGSRVLVPFGGRVVTGIVTRVFEGSYTPTPKAVLRTEADEPLLAEGLLTTIERAAAYYRSPIGEAMRAAVPPIPGTLVAGTQAKKSRVVGQRRVETFALTESGRVAQPRGPAQRRVLAELQAEPKERQALLVAAETTAATLRALLDAGWVTAEQSVTWADPFFSRPVEYRAAPELSAEQRVARDAIVAALGAAPAALPRSFLLKGVTGSGKTEVYLAAMQHALSLGRGSLLLLPEIGLTPQFVERLRARFGDEIAVLHSGLSDKERALHWHRLQRGSVRIAVGARSAVFAPVPSLGLIVVDEEHDPSYKQEEGFRYHARDVALLRMQDEGAVCVLGSATPSLESYAHARAGKHQLLRMNNRSTPHPLPTIHLVDLNQMKAGPSGEALLSLPLHRAIERALGAGEQSILFLNRRGFAPTLQCALCSGVQRCPGCAVALTEHRYQARRVCHYCDFWQPLHAPCLTCGHQEFVSVGLGTERLAELLGTQFPGARLARIDRDVSSPAALEETMQAIHRREIDIIVGTQMITKGHDLPWVTTVGVVLADQSLFFPDFRASERTFQLLAQVAGRAGRGERPGHVYIQTYQPGHYAIQCAQRQDFDAFAEQELRERGHLGYPPVGKMVALRMDALDEILVRREAGRIAQAMLSARPHPSLVLLGPAKAPIEKVRSRYRYRIFLRGEAVKELHAWARVAEELLTSLPKTVRGSLDIDPLSML